MVDCGNPRCAQERRSFRRELQGWSKKLPLILGLERIAADYVDDNTARLLLNPYPSWEHEFIRDFEPCKNCFHCEKKLPNVYKRIQRIINDAKKGKESNGKICLRSLQDLMPFCVDFYIHGFGRELFSDAVKAYFLTAVQQLDVQEDLAPCIPETPSNDVLAKLRVPHLTVSRSGKKQEGGRQRYSEKDLDCAVSDIRSGKLGTRRAAMIYGIPRSTLRNKLVKPEREEVTISSGGNECPPVTDLEFHKSACVHHLPNFKMSEAGLCDFSESVQKRMSAAFITASAAYPVGVKLEPDGHELFFQHRLNQIRRMHNLNGLSEAQPRPAHVNHLKLPLLIDVVRKLVHQRFMEVKHDYGWKKNSCEVKMKHDTELFSPFGPYLPTFSRYHSTSHNDENMSTPLYKHIMEGIYTNMLKEQYPIHRSFAKVNESSRIGDTLKDIIAKTISEKMKFRDGSSDEGSPPVTPEAHRNLMAKSMDQNQCNLDLEVPKSNKERKYVIDCCSPPKRPRKEGSKSGGHLAITPIVSSSSAKKTRPKRGQYRKYNSQLLMDAVRAVQRGEMSVHRAGSYFGVPHSTLEYKVKERHLMRQKKLRDTHSSASSSKNSVTVTVSQAADRESSLTPEDDALFTSKKHNGSSSAHSSISSTSPPPVITCHPKTSTPCTSLSFPPSSSSSSPLPVLSSALSVPPNKDLSSLAWFQPYLTITSQHLDPAIGLIPSSLTVSNSASELLRQLQHKVQTKGSSFPSDCTFELPCTKERVFDLTQTSSSGTTLSDRLALYNESL